MLCEPVREITEASGQGLFLPGGKICRLAPLQNRVFRLPDGNAAYIKEWLQPLADLAAWLFRNRLRVNSKSGFLVATPVS